MKAIVVTDEAARGPEALGIDAWARRLFAATGDERTVVSATGR